MSGRELVSNPMVYAALIGLFVWLIPLWHAIRGGSVLAAIEVLALLALGVAAPVVVLLTTFNLGDLVPALGALGAIPALGASALLWLGALLIALAADLGRAFRRVERQRSYGGPVLAELGRRYDPRT